MNPRLRSYYVISISAACLVSLLLLVCIHDTWESFMSAATYAHGQRLFACKARRAIGLRRILALCLHGHIRAIRPEDERSLIIRAAHHTISQRLVEANRRAGVQVDVFMHSWHPELKSELDALYSPIASAADEVIAGLHTVRSQHLSLRRVLTLAMQHSACATWVMISRLDVLLYSDVLVPNLSPLHVWLPRLCEQLEGRQLESASGLEGLDASALHVELGSACQATPRGADEVGTGDQGTALLQRSFRNAANGFTPVRQRHGRQNSRQSSHQNGRQLRRVLWVNDWWLVSATALSPIHARARA